MMHTILTYLEHLVVLAVLVVMGWFSFCTLRDNQQARAYASRKAHGGVTVTYEDIPGKWTTDPPKGRIEPFRALIIHDRLTDPTEAEKAILEARRKARERLDREGRTKWPTHDDYDIDAITRQIEEQN